MALSLIDIFVIGGLFFAGSMVGSLLSHTPIAILLGGVAAVLLFTWPIYKRLHFKPLFLPRCPHCHKRPDSYQLASADWPKATLVCALCEAPTEIWMQREVNREEASNEMPSLYLRWPEFIGLWRSVR